MSMGGGGNTGTTRYEWNEGVKPYWEQALGLGNYYGNIGLGGPGQEYQRYPGERIADFNDDHWNNFQRTRNVVEGGSYDTNQARDQAYSTARGDYLGMNPFGTGQQGTTGYDAQQGTTNPYASKLNPWAEMYTNTSVNPLVDARTSTQRNQFSGVDSPYFRQQLQGGLEDIGKQFERTTAADTRARFNKAGIFGGGAHEEALKANEEALGKSLSSFASGMLNDQYNRSSGMEESFLGRDLANQQYNQNYGSGLWESGLNRDLQNQQYNKGAGLSAWDAMYGRGFQGSESALDRQFQADQGGIGRDWQGFENERGRMLQSIPMGMQGQQLDLDRYGAGIGIGDRIMGRDQAFLDQRYSDWNQEQNYGRDMLTWFTGLLSAAQGGAPATSFSSIQNRGNPLSQGVGALGTAYGLFG